MRKRESPFPFLHMLYLLGSGQCGPDARSVGETLGIDCPLCGRTECGEKAGGTRRLGTASPGGPVEERPSPVESALSPGSGRRLMNEMQSPGAPAALFILLPRARRPGIIPGGRTGSDRPRVITARPPTRRPRGGIDGRASSTPVLQRHSAALSRCVGGGHQRATAWSTRRKPSYETSRPEIKMMRGSEPAAFPRWTARDPRA